MAGQQPIDRSGTPPDPVGADTFDEISARLQLLRAWAGDPSYRVIHKRILQSRKARRIPEQPALNTVYRCFEVGRSRLDVELIVDIARVLLGDEARAIEWRRACQALLGKAAQTATISVAVALPEELPVFTGRVDRLGQLVDFTDTRIGSGAVAVSVIDGMAGIGKTQFVVRVGHELLRHRDFVHVLFVNLRGFHAGFRQPPADPGAVLEAFLRVMGVSGRDIPRDLKGRVTMYRSLARDNPILVVLDNAADEAQVIPLLPNDSGSVALVTSRHRLAGVPDAHHVRLDEFTAAEALDYLRRAVGTQRVEDDKITAARIAEALGGHPLALAQTAGRIRAHPDWALTDHLERVLDRRENLRLDDAVDVSFSLSYEDLQDDLRRVFRLLALQPGMDIDAYATAALAGADLAVTQQYLDDLLASNLIHQRAPGRYELHDLIRVYVTSRVQDEERGLDRREALSRLFDHYLYTASSAMDVAFPAERDRRPRIESPGTPSPNVSEPAQATGWLEAERTNLMAVAAYAALRGWPDHVGNLAVTIRRFLDTNAYYPDALAIHDYALQAARSQGNPEGEATSLRNLGTVFWQTGRYPEALGHLEQALLLNRHQGDRAAEANTLDNLGGVLWELGRLQEALVCYHDALALNRAAGSRASEGRTRNNLGVVYLRLGRDDMAVEHLQQAIAIAREIGDRAGEGTLNNLGVACARLGRSAEAVAHIELALTTCRETGYRAGTAAALDSLGIVHRLGHRYDEALSHHQEALALAREIGDRGLEADILNSAGETLDAAQRFDEARAYHESALTLSRESGIRFEQGRALDGIARACHGNGLTQEARLHWQEALGIYAELSVPEADAVRTRLVQQDHQGQ